MIEAMKKLFPDAIEFRVKKSEDETAPVLWHELKPGFFVHIALNNKTPTGG